MTIWNSQTKQYHGVTDITVKDSEPALKITQSGTGDSLVVQDDTDPDSTPFVIDSEGYVLVGNTIKLPVTSSAYPRVQINESDTVGGGFCLQRWSASQYSAPSFQFRRSRGINIGLAGIVNSGDECMILDAFGDDGVQGIIAASIKAAIDGTPGLNDMPGRLSFFTTSDGSASLTERVRINSSGQVLIGTTTAGASKLVVNDESIQIKTAKTPSAADATGTAGQVCWDADYVYVCVATDTWKRAAIATWP